MKTYTVSSLIAVLLAAVSSAALAQGITFRNSEFKFRFVYPSDWKPVTPRGPNVKGLIQGPRGRLSSCNIVVRRVPQLEQFTRQQIIEDSLATVWSEEDWRNALGPTFADAAIRERRLTKASNYPVQFSVIEVPYETIAAKIHGIMIQFITMTPGILWNFGCTAGGNTLEEARRNYDIMRPQFLAILSSFVFEESFATTVVPTPTAKSLDLLDEQIKAHNAKIVEEAKKRCLGSRPFGLNPIDSMLADEKCRMLGIEPQ